MSASSAQAEALNRRYTDASAEEILAAALRAFHPHLVFACSLGLEDVVVLDLIARGDPKPRIFTLDTGRLNQETYDTLAAVKARAKERIFSFRDEFGQWDPKHQRPELWDIYNARCFPGENIRVFPISNWTELDVWQYIQREALDLPSIQIGAALTSVQAPQKLSPR